MQCQAKGLDMSEIVNKLTSAKHVSSLMERQVGTEEAKPIFALASGLAFGHDPGHLSGGPGHWLFSGAFSGRETFH